MVSDIFLVLLAFLICRERNRKRKRKRGVWSVLGGIVLDFVGKGEELCVA